MDSENSGIPATMLVGPTGYGGNYGGGFGNMFGGDGAWLLLLVILLCNGGWGGFGMGGFGGGLGIDFPWLLNGQNQINANTNSGFDHAATQSALGNIQTAITSGFGDVATQLCSGFAGTTAAVTGAQNAIAQQLYSNEIASLNRSFAEQTANTAGFNGVQSSLCDIRYGNATNTRDIIDSQTRGTQAILDKLCQVELDGYKRENDQLRTQLNMANLAASQTAQTAELRQSGATQLNQLVSELRSCPLPAQPVYGNTPIFSCTGNNGCGCGGFVN